MFASYAYLRDEKSTGTNGGTFTSGAWQTRDLNTEVTDSAGIVSVASNQFTLGAGTYIVMARAPGRQCGAHKLQLWNATDSTEIAVGSSAWADTSADNPAVSAFVVAKFTLSGTKALELRHRCGTTHTTYGFGVAFNTDSKVEVYAEVEIFKLSADLKISGLSAVTDLLDTDEFVLARSGATKKIAADDLMPMQLLDDQVLGSTGTLDFTSIPGTFKHLYIIASVRLDAAVTSDVVRLRLNNDSGANYDWAYDYFLSGTGSNGGSVAGDTSMRYGEAPGASAGSGRIGAFEIRIPDYAGTTFNKGILAHGGRADSNRMSQNNDGQWLSTAAVTRVTLIDTYAVGSRASLYGLR